NEKKSQLINEFWNTVASSQKRKFTEAAERTALVEKHITNVVSSTFEREQTIREEITKQEMIVRNKFVNCLENKDLGLDVSHKRQRLQVDNVEPQTPENKEYEHDSGSSDGPYVNSNSCYEVQDSRYTSPTPHSHDDPFTEDTEDENVIITNVSPRFSSSKKKFRTYIDEAILHANNKGLYVESHTHEILSLSSILVLIPNSYSTKMVEVFGLQILESIYHEYAPTLSITLDTEIENIYRNAIKTCLRDSRGSAIDFLCKNIANRSELRDNFGILMIDLIRSLPFDKIRNEPSELTLITNFLNGIMKEAFHDPDKYLVQWPNTALAESKIRKFDGSRTKQPDFVVSLNYQSRAKNVIYVGEVTGPSEKNNVYKNCLDLIRIGIFMKDCIDSAILQGAGIKILGFQCIAYKLDFYVLDLNGEGLYTMNHIAQISIPETVKGLFTFIDELHILLNIRDILMKSYDVFIDKLQNPGLVPLELKSSFKRKTLDTPEFKRLVSKTHCVKRECPLWFGRY
ncbi:13248_t:CDS:2, partial [Funneliformis caledonium]